MINDYDNPYSRIMTNESEQSEDKEPISKPSADRIAAAKAAAAKVRAAKAAKEGEVKSAGVAKPAIAKPKVPVKEKEPLKDNEDGTITDPSTGYMWKKSDAWLDTHKYYTWFDHQEYVQKVNKEKFAGYDNWRIPTKAEAVSIHTKDKECMDKNGTPYFVDPIFSPGGAGNTWIQECSEDKIVRFDWKTGVDTVYPSKDIWASMRLIRIEGEALAVDDEPVKTVEAIDGVKEEVSAKKVEGKTATPVAKPSSGGKKGPTPKKNYTPEMKAEILKRAKAYAAKVKSEKGG